MQSKQFDALVMRSVGGASRRQALQTGFGAMLAVLAGALTSGGDGDEAIAKRKRRHARSRKEGKEASRQVDTRVEGKKGKNKKKCKGGTTKCGKQCVSLQSDPANCGQCGSVCPAGQSCQAGTCVLGCASERTACGNQCVDLQSDNENCGQCGKACETGHACQNGECVLECATGKTVCGDTCVDLQTAFDHCGACDSPCGANQTCNAGSCVAGCTVCASGCQFGDLPSAVANASTGATITIAPGYYDADVTMPRDMTLRRCGDGGEVVLRNASNRRKAITINAGATVRLEDITVDRNPAHQFGGGVHNLGTLTMERCTVRGLRTHSDDPFSGGIDNLGVLTITGCTITDNAPRGVHSLGRATLIDSTIEASGHVGVFQRDADLTVTGCTIKNNPGSGLSIDRADAQSVAATITGSTFAHNTGNSQGAGIFSSGAVVTVRDSVFRDNVGFEGGAIMVFGELTLERCQIQRNTATAGSGGVIIAGTTTISDCDISANQGGSGGGIQARPGSRECDESGCRGGYPLTVTDSTIHGNSCTYQGGAQGGGVAVGAWCTATFSNSSISENTTDGQGGGVWIAPNGEANFAQCTINENRAEKEGWSREGGGIYNHGLVKFRAGARSEVKGNSAYYGGGIYNNGGQFSPDAEFVLASCDITENMAVAGGGIWGSGGAITFVAGGSCSVTGNSADVVGGGIALRENATISLNDATVTNNNPDNCSASFPIPGCVG